MGPPPTIPAGAPLDVQAFIPVIFFTAAGLPGEAAQDVQGVADALPPQLRGQGTPCVQNTADLIFSCDGRHLMVAEPCSAVVLVLVGLTYGSASCAAQHAASTGVLCVVARPQLVPLSCVHALACCLSALQAPASLACLAADPAAAACRGRHGQRGGGGVCLAHAAIPEALQLGGPGGGHRRPPHRGRQPGCLRGSSRARHEGQPSPGERLPGTWSAGVLAGQLPPCVAAGLVLAVKADVMSACQGCLAGMVLVAPCARHPTLALAEELHWGMQEAQRRQRLAEAENGTDGRLADEDASDSDGGPLPISRAGPAHCTPIAAGRLPWPASELLPGQAACRRCDQACLAQRTMSQCCHAMLQMHV